MPGVASDGVAAEAVALFKALRRRPELAALIDSAACEFEVPFSVRLSDDAGSGPPEPVVVRGSIDCLAALPDGRVTVVELKTGRPQSWHEAQIDTYVRAARALFPGVPVEGQLVYATAGETPAPPFDATGTAERASNQLGGDETRL